MDIKADGDVWSGGKDAAVVRWDERSRRPATKLKGEVNTEASRRHYSPANG